jgi:hypothetical protein
MEHRKDLRQLAAFSSPNIATTEEGRRRQVWVVRALRSWGEEESAVLKMASDLQAQAWSVLLDRYQQIHDLESLRDARPEVRLILMDELHAYVVVEMGNGGLARSNPGTMATFEVLRGIDERIGVDDLQGVPRRFWLFLDRE